MKDNKKRKVAGTGSAEKKAAAAEASVAAPAKKKSAIGGTKPAGKEKENASIDVTQANGEEASFRPLTLQDVHVRIKKLCMQVPPIPEHGFYVEEADDINRHDEAQKNEENTVIDKEKGMAIGNPPNNLDKVVLKDWANKLQVVLEELGLLLCCVSTATYRWGTDRSGAADQNLSLLNEELNSTQDQIASRVTPRLRNVLTPVVDLVVDKTVTTTSKQPNGEAVETKQNVFTRKLEDPDFVHLCYEILARNAPMMRLVVLSNFQKMAQCIGDYLAAQRNDTEHHRDFAY